jgi:hypothetical protein
MRLVMGRVYAVQDGSRVTSTALDFVEARAILVPRYRVD